MVSRKYRILGGLVPLAFVFLCLIGYASTAPAFAQADPSCDVTATVRTGTINEFDIVVSDASPNGWWLVQFGDRDHVDVEVIGGTASTFHAYAYTVGAVTDYVIRVIYPNVGGLQRCVRSISIDDTPANTPTPTATPTETPTPTPTPTATPPAELDPLMLEPNGFSCGANPRNVLPNRMTTWGRLGDMPAVDPINWSQAMCGWVASVDIDALRRIRVDTALELALDPELAGEWTVVPGGWDRIGEPACEVVGTLLNAPNHYDLRVLGRHNEYQIRVDDVELVWYEAWPWMTSGVEAWLTIVPGQLAEYEVSAAINANAPAACSATVQVDNRPKRWFLPIVQIGQAQASMSATRVSGINIYDVTLVPNRSGWWRLKVDGVNWVEVEVNSALTPVAVRHEFTIEPGVSKTYVVTAHYPLEGPSRGVVNVIVDNSPP